MHVHVGPFGDHEGAVFEGSFDPVFEGGLRLLVSGEVCLDCQLGLFAAETDEVRVHGRVQRQDRADPRDPGFEVRCVVQFDAREELQGRLFQEMLRGVLFGLVCQLESACAFLRTACFEELDQAPHPLAPGPAAFEGLGDHAADERRNVARERDDRVRAVVEQPLERTRVHACAAVDRQRPREESLHFRPQLRTALLAVCAVGVGCACVAVAVLVQMRLRVSAEQDVHEGDCQRKQVVAGLLVLGPGARRVGVRDRRLLEIGQLGRTRGAAHARLGQLDRAEVGQELEERVVLGFAFTPQDVVRLDVLVRHALAVELAERLGHLPAEVEQVVLVQEDFARAPQVALHARHDGQQVVVQDLGAEHGHAAAHPQVQPEPAQFLVLRGRVLGRNQLAGDLLGRAAVQAGERALEHPALPAFAARLWVELQRLIDVVE